MLSYLPDLESDFSAVHRIGIDFDAEEFGGLTSRRFFQLAERLPAYPGVMQAHLMAEQQKEQERGAPPVARPTTNGGSAAGSGFEGVKVIPLTPELAAGGMAALGLSGVVDYATSG